MKLTAVPFFFIHFICNQQLHLNAPLKQKSCLLPISCESSELVLFPTNTCFFHLAESHQQRHGRVAFLWKWNFNNLHTLSVNFHTIPAVLFLYSNKLGIAAHGRRRGWYLRLSVFRLLQYTENQGERYRWASECSLWGKLLLKECGLFQLYMIFNEFLYFLFLKINASCKKFSDRRSASIIYLYIHIHIHIHIHMHIHIYIYRWVVWPKKWCRSL